MRTTHTSPKAPRPMTFIMSKSSRANLKDFTHVATGFTAQKQDQVCVTTSKHYHYHFKNFQNKK